jgi:hypothetical protein
MIRLRFLLSLLVLMPSLAMAQVQTKSTQPNRCLTSVTSQWLGGPTPRLRVEAFSDGPTCVNAVVVYVVRDGQGKALYTNSFAANSVSLTAGMANVPAMRRALTDWLRLAQTSYRHENLPAWPLNADGPVLSEFPFMPDETIQRLDYLSIKRARTPILCYVQGMESLKCLVYRNGGLEPFGLQSFPG